MMIHLHVETKFTYSDLFVRLPSGEEKTEVPKQVWASFTWSLYTKVSDKLTKYCHLST